MPVPKQRRSKSKKRIKHATWKIETPQLRPCSNCNEMGLPHHVCSICGFYNGKQIISIKEKVKEKKES